MNAMHMNTPAGAQTAGPDSIRYALEKRQECRTLQYNIRTLEQEAADLNRAVKPDPLAGHDDSPFWKNLGGMASPFAAGIIALLFLDAKAYGVFVFFLAVGIACVFLFRFSKQKMNEYTTEINRLKAESETDWQMFLIERDDKLRRIQSDLETLRRQSNAAASETAVPYLPQQYQSDDALNIIYGELMRNPGITMQQAMYQYDLIRQQREFEQMKQRQLEEQQYSLRMQQQQLYELQRAQQELAAEQSRQQRVTVVERHEESSDLEKGLIAGGLILGGLSAAKKIADEMSKLK
ncbi:MAG: hypothetical protein MJ065_04785 [Oscillospiraceae bacterium]|nr:hypothetical protein [Oscillospiraceae bacterium]